jgi:hypothetical protein
MLVSLLTMGGCSDPPKEKDIQKHWLHSLEREGLDISPEGVFAHYRLSPQRLELFGYKLDGHEFILDDLVTSQAEEQRLAFTVSGNHLQLEPSPGAFQNFEKSPHEDPPVLMPEIVGLWLTEVQGSKEFWNFTDRGTVFANIELSPGRYEGLWAKFKLESTGRALGSDRRKMLLWGIQGKTALGGETKTVELQAAKLKIGDNTYRRIETASEIGKKPAPSSP